MIRFELNFYEHGMRTHRPQRTLKMLREANKMVAQDIKEDVRRLVQTGPHVLPGTPPEEYTGALLESLGSHSLDKGNTVVITVGNAMVPYAGALDRGVLHKRFFSFIEDGELTEVGKWAKARGFVVEPPASAGASWDTRYKKRLKEIYATEKVPRPVHPGEKMDRGEYMVMPRDYKLTKSELEQQREEREARYRELGYGDASGGATRGRPHSTKVGKVGRARAKELVQMNVAGSVAEAMYGRPDELEIVKLVPRRPPRGLWLLEPHPFFSVVWAKWTDNRGELYREKMAQYVQELKGT